METEMMGVIKRYITSGIRRPEWLVALPMDGYVSHSYTTAQPDPYVVAVYKFWKAESDVEFIYEFVGVRIK